MSGHKSIGRWLLAAALACVVAALFVAARRAQPPRLMDRARRMPSSSWGGMDSAFPLPGPALMRLHPQWNTTNPAGWRTFRLDTGTGVETPLPALDAVLNRHDGDDWKVSPDGHTLLFRSHEDARIAYGLCGLDGPGLTRTRAAIHLAPVPLSQSAPLGWPLLSPRGACLAWQTSRPTPSRWPRPLQPLLRRLGVKMPSSQTEEVWVSDSEGRGRRLVGGLTTADADRNEFRLTEWTGDERTLTFEYRHALYAVPVE